MINDVVLVSSVQQSESVIYIHSGELFFVFLAMPHGMQGSSSLTRNRINLEIVILSEVSQTEKDKYMILLICGIFKKKKRHK